jgi:hypothetical protein
VSTFGALIDRCNREWLYPPADQPARFFLNDSGGISSSDATAVTNTSWLNPEEEDLLGPGTIVEMERELILIGSVSGSSPAITLAGLKRGLLGTTAAAHADQGYIILAPEYGRQATFDAINDAIDDLWPALYKVRTEIIPTGGGWVDIGADVEEILETKILFGSQWATWNAGDIELLLDFPLASSERAVQFNGVPANKGAIIKYKARPMRATAETDTLVSLNIDPSWEKAITVGAAASLLRGADIDSASLEYVTETLGQEGFPVGSGENISNALLRFQDFLIGRRARALDVRVPPTRVIERIL